jgi:uncharacterized membrane protein
MLVYEITELQPPPGAQAPDVTEARAVNLAGSVAGDAAVGPGPGDVEPILWNDSGVPQVLESLPPGGIGAGINDGGDVVGLIHATAPTRAFLHHSTGELEDLAPVVGGEMSIAFDVNNEAIVVGYAGQSGPGGSGHAFVYESKNASLTTLDPLPGDAYALATAVNGLGHVIGWSAETMLSPHGHLFIGRGNGPENLGQVTSPGGGDINDSDVITGSRPFPPIPFASAFRLDAAAANPSFEDLGQSLPAGFAGSYGSGINDEGVIVGSALDADNQPHAMIHLPDGPDAGWHDLNDAVVDADGWDLRKAWAISDSGYIVGVGMHHRRQRAFLLRPLTAQTGDDKIAKVLCELIMMFGGAPFGAAGTGITGGGHPVPIGPQEFALAWRRLSAAERDMYIGAAIRDLGGVVSNRGRADAVEQAGVEVVKSALAEFERRTPS